MKKLIRIILLAVISIYGQGTTGFSLLKMTVDVRSAAMSGAGVTGVGDVGFAATNPAALAGMDKLSAMVMINDGLLDETHGYAAVQLIKGRHNLSLFTNYLKFPGIEIRGDKPSANPAGISDAYNLALGVGYATTWNDWQIGLRAKYLFEKYYLDSAPGWALDLGLQRSEIMPGMDFGVVLYNVGWMSTLREEATKLPLFLKTGISYTVPGSFFDGQLRLMPELQWITRQALISRLGLQYAFNGYLNLYGGVQSDGDIFKWAAGFGVNYQAFKIQYAYAPFGYDLGSSNHLSVLFSF